YSFGRPLGSRLLRRVAAERDDLRRRGFEAEVELELTLARGKHRADNAAERNALSKRLVGLLDDAEIGEREEGVGVGAHHRADQSALDQIAEMVLAQGAVAREQVADRVILPLQRVGRRHAGKLAEFVLGEDADWIGRGALRVQFLGALELVGFVARIVGRWAEAFGADHQNRRLGADFLRGGAAETLDERSRILAAERAELSSEDDNLSGERRRGPVRRQ